MKTCSKCCEEKDNSEFYFKRFKLEACCKVCHNARSKTEKVLKKARDYQQTPKAKYYKYAYYAEKRGFSWKLTFEDFMDFWNKDCYYCGDLIQTVGIDRINNDIGYTKLNCISCCAFCNIAKNNNTQKDFIQKCFQIAAKHGGSNV